MVQGCGANCSKMMLIIFNVIFWLSGAALIGVGVWFLVDPDASREIEDIVKLTNNELIKYAAYLLLGVGGLVFIVAFIGCCGAFKENKCLLTVYIFFMFLVLAGELAGGILAYIYRSKIEETVKDEVINQMETKQYPNDTFWGIMDFAQSEFRCCGLNGSIDYTKAEFEGPDVNYPYPYSCCPLKAGYEPADYINATMVNCIDGPHQKGCKEELIDMVESKLLVLIGIGIGLAVFQIFMFIFAICLCRRAGEKA